MNFRRCSLLLVFALVLSLGPSRASADATIGDAALIVSVSTLGGAVLGASTLPFYGSPGDHTKNIFYGAALGAVVGVMISAYTGVKDGPDEDNARLAPPKDSRLSVNESPATRLLPETIAAAHRQTGFADGSVLVWSPLASVKF